MKISLKEIKKYVDISGLSPEEIANKLTFAGVEVEGIEHFAIGTNLVIGKIIDIKNHPDSDHLHICQVDLGAKYGIKQIVCGAPNARLGLKVIVAMIGAKLANDVIIKETTIRGVDSHGMLCSLVELGVDTKFLSEEQIKGIEEINEDICVGEENVLSVLEIDDTILDLKPLANRSDCNALINVAKEISCLFSLPFNNLVISTTKETYIDDFRVGSTTQKCSKFLARVVKDIDVHESPLWLKRSLNCMGVRSINNIVDIGNYVMLITGQPLHMYDYDSLDKKELIVKDDIETMFCALDDKEYEITKGDLCVTSNNRIECLAGVMGSLHSETTLKSKNIVIEAAIFDSKSVRQTSNRLGLISESSQRFNKGLNKFNQQEAIDLASYLLKTMANATDFSQVIVYDENRFEHVSIKSSYSYINKRLSTNYSSKTINDVLTRDFINIKEIDSNEFIANIPDYRIDISTGADLSEEVIRILGFDDIKVELPKTQISLGKMSDMKYKKSLISEFLVDNGYFEILTYTLTNSYCQDNFQLLGNNESIEIMNKITDDRKYLRNNLLYSLLNTALYNVNRKNNDFKIFEISDIYTKGKQQTNLSVVLCGNDLRQGLLKQEKFSFYDLKGIIESMMAMFGIEKTRYSFLRIEDTNKIFHFGKSAYLIVDGKKVGILGEIHPQLISEMGFSKNINLLGLEMILDNILSLKTGKIKAKPISRFHVIHRDISFIINKKYEIGSVINEIKKIDKYINSVEIFDIYKANDDIEKVSIALKIGFLSFDETLKDEHIVLLVEKIFKVLTTKYSIEVRN